MNKVLGFLLIIVVPVLLYLYIDKERSMNGTGLSVWGLDTSEPLVTVGDVPINIEVADTPEARARGLSYRPDLPATNGMLFIFDASDYHGIWMKDMLFAIDVIWIDEHLRVIDITPNLQPGSYPKIFEPRSPARFAIETNARYAESFSIEIGDDVALPRYLIPEDLHIGE